MSIKVASLVWENGPSQANEMLLLLALADHANDAGGQCYPGIELLAHKCRVSERQVQRTLRQLEVDGWITVVYGGGRSTPNHYTIVLSRLSDTPGVSSTSPQGDDQETVTSRAETVTSRVEKGDAHVTRTIKNHQEPSYSRLADPSTLAFSTQPAPSEPRRRSSAVDQQWQPDDALVAWTRKNAPDINSRVEWANFIDHHTAKGTLMKDWRAAWRTWARNAQKWGKGGGSGGARRPSEMLLPPGSR